MGYWQLTGVRKLRPAQIMQLKDEVLGQVRLVAPDDPAHTGIYEAVLVSGSVDRLDPRQLKVPLRAAHAGVRKGGDEPARGRVHVYRDINPRLLLVLVEDLGDLLDRLVVARVGRPEDDKDADRVLVDRVPHQVGVQAVRALLRDRQDAGLDVKVARELLQRDLRVGAHDDVGLGRVLALGLPELLPPPLHGQAAEVDGLGGADGGRADGLLGLLHAPEVGEDADAALGDPEHGRVLVVVCEVLGDVLLHYVLGFVLHPGAYERCQVQVWLAVQVQLVLQQGVDGVPRCSLVRHLVLGDPGLAGIAGVVGG